MSVSLALAEDLDHLDADVGSVELGEDKDIGLTRNLALPLDLLFSDSGDNSRVELEFAVDSEIGPSLLGDSDRLVDLVNAGSCSAAESGEAQESASGLPAHQSLDVVAGSDGDRCQFIGSGLRVETAVSQSDLVALRSLESGDLCKSEDGRDVHAVLHTDGLLCSDQHIACRIDMSTECAVHIAGRFHDHRVVHGVLHLALASFFGQHQLGILHIAGNHSVAGRLIRNVHNLHALEGNADSLSGLSDHGGIIDQHRCADSVVKNSAGSKKCLIRLALRKCYSFGILFGFFDQSFNQAHVHLSVFYISGQLSLFSMTANAITKGRS